MNYRHATPADAATLAVLNHALIRDEGHRNPMSVAELEERMAGWLAGEYQAVLIEVEDRPVGYALFRRDPQHFCLRQYYVVPEQRRRGIGRAALDWLRQKVWNGQRVRVDVLITNEVGIAFWRSVGFRDYCLTLEMDRIDSLAPEITRGETDGCLIPPGSTRVAE